MVASDRISTYDVVHPNPIPDKGKVLTGLSVFWFDRTGRHLPQPPRLVHRGARGGARPGAARRAARDGPDRVRRARLHHRLGLEGLPAHAARSAGSSCPTGLRESEQLPGADLHAGHEGRGRRPRREHRLRPRGRDPRRPRAARGAARALARALRLAAEHARARGIILADTKFEFGRRADGTIVLGDEVLTPDSSRFWPADGYEPGRASRRSTSSTCATGPPARAGTSRRRRRRSPTTWSRARASCTWTPTSGSPASRSPPGSSGPALEGARPDPAEGGHPRPAGPDRRAGAAGARLRGRAATCTSAAWSSSTCRTPRRIGEMCEKLLANPLIEDYEILVRRAVKFGVIRFPGSCDEVDALLAAAASATPSCSGTATATCAASTRSSSPAASPTATTCAPGAIARFSPVMEAVREFALAGGPVLGICNGFQVLCEAGLLPGRAAAQRRRCASSAGRWTLEVENAAHAVHARVRARASGCRSRSSTRPAATTRPSRRSTSWRPRARCVLRYAAGQNPNGSARDIAGVANRPRNVVGLMPHPEHAVDPLTGSADGGKLFESLVAPSGARARMSAGTADARHRELGLTDAEYDAIVDQLEREPNDVELAVFSLMWSRALRLQALEEAAAAAAHRGPARRDGPGGERRRGRRRRRAGGGLQGRVAQPPERGRAVPGRGHRASAASCATSSRSARGRSPCSTRCASASSTPSARATCSTTRSAGIGHYGNSIGVATVGGEIYFEAPYEQNCLVNAMCVGLAPRERLIRSAAAGVGNLLVLLGALTGRDGIGGASVLATAELDEEDESKRPTVQIGDPFEEKKLRRVLPRAARRGAARVAPGPRRRRALLELVRDGDQGRGRARHRRRARAAARGGHGAVRGHGLRVAGADAVRRGAGAARRRARALRALGGARDGDRRGHRQPPPARARRRRGRRRHAGGGAGRRLPAVRPRAGAPAGADLRAARSGASATTPIRARRCSRCCARRASPASAGPSSSTTRSSARAPCGGPEQADAAVLSLARRRPARSPSRSTATAAGWPAIPTAARSRRCSSARATSPASARSRSGSPTA